MKHNRLFYIVIALIALSVPAFAQTPWQQTEAANVIFQYRVTQDGQNLEGKIIGESTGWVAVGFNPTSVMRNANIIIGYVNGANTSIRDDWGNSNTSHVSDTSQGGTSDVTLISGNEAAGVTTIHFTIPLVTADQYDRPLQVGSTYTVILARGANGADNYTGMHADAGYGSINLQAPVSNDDPLHAPSLLRVLPNYPNPFNPRTTLRYFADKAGEHTLSIYNLRGELVHRESANHQPGEYSRAWEAAGLPSGNYILRLEGPGGKATRVITLQK